MTRMRVHSEVASVAPAWDALADALCASPFVRPRHVEIHRRAFGGGRLRIVTVERDGDVVAVQPLQSLRGSWRAVTGWHTPVNQLLVTDEEALASLLWFLRRHGPARTELRYLPDEDLQRLQSAVASHDGLTLRHRVPKRSPYVPIDGRDFGTYQQQLRSRFRSELRRRRRRLGEHGEVRLALHDGREGLDELLRRGFELEASGWKWDHGTAIAARADTRTYYTELAGWAAANGWLLLAFLEVGDRQVAFDLCVEEAGRHHLLKTGYDPEWRTYAPGQILREDMLRRAFDVGLASYEFGGDDDAYKLEWADRVRASNVVDLHPDTMRGGGSRILQERVRPLAKRVEAIARQRGEGSARAARRLVAR